jgi:hypothetical protein
VIANDPSRRLAISVLEGLDERLRHRRNHSLGMVTHCDEHELIDLSPLVAAWLEYSVVDLEPCARQS